MMELLLLSADYLSWHYSQAVTDMLEIGGNFLWLVHSSFSIPAKRACVAYEGGILRLLGGAACFLMVCFGLIVLMLALVAESAIFIAWIFLPFILLLLLALAAHAVFPSFI